MSSRITPAHAGGTALSVVLLAAWLGAGVFFAVVVARAAFDVLPTRTLAGMLVGRTLPALLVAGVVICSITALLTLLQKGESWNAGRIVSLAASLGAAALCAVGQFVIGPRIERLRAQLGTSLESVPVGDPVRSAFGRLHGLSVLALGLAMLLAIIALVAAFRYLTSGRAR